MFLCVRCCEFLKGNGNETGLTRWTMQDLCVSAVYLVTPYCESNGSYLSISVMPFTDSGQYQNQISLGRT